MLFVPVWDMNRLKSIRFQYATISIIIINIFVFFYFETGLFYQNAEIFTNTYAFKPFQINNTKSILNPTSQHVTFITYLFLHGSFLHLLGNMVFLFVFGDNVEDAMGSLRFIIFYLLCGIAAAITHMLVSANPTLPLIGASGAVSGVIAAYLMLYPNIRLWVLVPVPIIPFIPLRFSAAFVIGVWILWQIANALIIPGGNTAWWAHIGGFAAGALLIPLMRRRGVALFDGATER